MEGSTMGTLGWWGGCHRLEQGHQYVGQGVSQFQAFAFSNQLLLKLVSLNTF